MEDGLSPMRVEALSIERPAWDRAASFRAPQGDEPAYLALNNVAHSERFSGGAGVGRLLY